MVGACFLLRISLAVVKSFMKFFVVVIAGLLSTTGFTQDMEFPDYRSKKDMFTRVTEKDVRSDVATFSMGGIEEIIGKLPLKSLPVTNHGADFIAFAGNDIEVSIQAEPFEPAKH